LSLYLFALSLFSDMLLMLETGALGLPQLAKNSDGCRAGPGVVEGAVFGPLGLLIGLSFRVASQFEAPPDTEVEHG
jgi:hypothetical protein